MSEEVICYYCADDVTSRNAKPCCESCLDRKIDETDEAAYARGAAEAREDDLFGIRQGDLIELAKGIRDGNKTRATIALDIIAAELGWSDIVAKGRAAH